MQAPKDHGIVTLKLEGPGKLSSPAPNSDPDSKARESKDPRKSRRPHWSGDWERDLGCPTAHPSEAPWSSKTTFRHLSDQVAVWSGDLTRVDVTYPLDWLQQFVLLAMENGSLRAPGAQLPEDANRFRPSQIGVTPPLVLSVPRRTTSGPSAGSSQRETLYRGTMQGREHLTRT